MTTYPEIRLLVEGAGLDIEARYRYGLWPSRWYRGHFVPLFKHIDRWAVQARPCRWISQNMHFVCRPGAGAVQYATAAPAGVKE